jgi:hypothetical protein
LSGSFGVGYLQQNLKENIFAQLENSEYLIFVDFKREQLAAATPPLCRGSLFSHQELAIASYLDTPVLAFQEAGVKQDDGILQFLQGNAIPFTDRHLLPAVIAGEVQRRGWECRWKNNLVLERPDPAQCGDSWMEVGGTRKHSRFFHIDVRNRHRRKMARNCYVYLERATTVEPLRVIPVRAVEIKWEGYTLPSAHIPPGNIRRFDGFYIFHDDPTRLHFQIFTDSTAFIPNIQGEGKYELDYSVVADGFPTARGSFQLNLDRSLNSTTLMNITRRAPDAATSAG